MSNTQHTPGPYEVDEIQHRTGIWANGVRLALVDQRPNTLRGEERANARLFAAAPELLAACEMCDRVITEIKEVPGGWDSGANRQNLIASRHYVRAAIARATEVHP